MQNKIGSMFCIGGILVWILFKFEGSQISSNGFLIEPFALIPLGYILVFIGLAIFLSPYFHIKRR